MKPELRLRGPVIVALLCLSALVRRPIPAARPAGATGVTHDAGGACGGATSPVAPS